MKPLIFSQHSFNASQGCGIENQGMEIEDASSSWDQGYGRGYLLNDYYPQKGVNVMQQQQEQYQIPSENYENNTILHDNQFGGQSNQFISRTKSQQINYYPTQMMQEQYYYPAQKTANYFTVDTVDSPNQCNFAQSDYLDDCQQEDQNVDTGVCDQGQTQNDCDCARPQKRNDCSCQTPPPNDMQYSCPQQNQDNSVMSYQKKTNQCPPPQEEYDDIFPQCTEQPQEDDCLGSQQQNLSQSQTLSQQNSCSSQPAQQNSSSSKPAQQNNFFSPPKENSTCSPKQDSCYPSGKQNGCDYPQQNDISLQASSPPTQKRSRCSSSSYSNKPPQNEFSNNWQQLSNRIEPLQETLIESCNLQKPQKGNCCKSQTTPTDCCFSGPQKNSCCQSCCTSSEGDTTKIQVQQNSSPEQCSKMSLHKQPSGVTKNIYNNKNYGCNSCDSHQ